MGVIRTVEPHERLRPPILRLTKDQVRQIAIYRQDLKEWKEIAALMNIPEKRLYKMFANKNQKALFLQMTQGKDSIVTPEDFDHALHLRLPKMLKAIDRGLDCEDPRIALDTVKWIIKRVDKSKAGGMEPFLPKVLTRLAEAEADWNKKVAAAKDVTPKLTGDQQRQKKLNEMGLDLLVKREHKPLPAVEPKPEDQPWRDLVDKPVN